MTIYDISKKAGVSIATVSRVLNGSANVNPDTKRKVLEVMEQCSYTPNVFARGLGLNTMNTIGILCADSSDIYLAKAVYFIEQRLRKNGYDSILCCTGYEVENKKKYLNLLISKKVDSVILVGSNFVDANEDNNSYIREASLQLPVMLLNADYIYPNVYSSLCDDYSAVTNAADKMIASGVKNILYLYNARSYSGIRKLMGFEAAIKNLQQKTRSEYTQLYTGSQEDIPAMVDFIVALKEGGLQFDGIITADDTLGVAAVKYAYQNGICIPDELSIISYNNSMLTYCCEPGLTSIDNKLEKLCEQLVINLLQVLSGKEVPRKTIFTGELIIRGTTRF